MSCHREADAVAPTAGTQRLPAPSLWTAIAGLSLGGVAAGVARLLQRVALVYPALIGLVEGEGP